MKSLDNILSNQMGAACSIQQENKVVKKKDAQGNIWEKAYFGSGSHFNHWLEQFIEIYGEENIDVEEYRQSELSCFGDGSDILKRIWVKRKNKVDGLEKNKTI